MDNVDLKFEEIKKIQFGELKVLPQMDKDLELRVRSLNMGTFEGVQEAKEVLSACFGTENQAPIKAFMDSHMKPINLSVLQAYLLGGTQAVDMVLRGAISMGAEK